MSAPSPRTTRDSIGIHARINKLLTLYLTAALVFAGAVTPTLAQAKVSASDRVDGRRASDLGVPTAAMPDVSMKSGTLVTSDGRILWERQPTAERSMASITKIMTAVVAMERSDPDEIVTVTRESLRVGESSSFLRLGQKLKMSELLEALLIKSGNDAAVAIAVAVGGSEDGFVALMNKKAAALGLDRTHFENAHGLDARGHYSCARDLAVLSRYAMSKPEFRAIVKKKRARIGSGSRTTKVESTNLLIGNYSGANGVKTGFTSKAGYCVIASANRDDIELQAVVLGTNGELARFREARELLDFGFAHYRPQRLASAGSVIGEAPVADYLDLAVPAAVSRDATVPVLDFAGPIHRTLSMAVVDAPVHIGDKVGVASFTQQGEVIATLSLVATKDVKKPWIFQRVGIGFIRVWRSLTGTR